MTPSSVATSAVVIVIVLVSLLTPCKGTDSVDVSHLSLTHRAVAHDLLEQQPTGRVLAGRLGVVDYLEHWAYLPEPARQRRP